MAKNNLILAGALVLVLFFAYGITFTKEMRVLKADHEANASGRNDATNAVTSSSKTNLNRELLEDAVLSAAANVVKAAAYPTDGFRPTTPGHSPGAGHSTGPASKKHN